MSEFIIGEIRSEDEGSFYCSASNPAGVATANFTLIVNDKNNGLDGGDNDEDDGGGGDDSENGGVDDGVTIVDATDEDEDDSMIKVKKSQLFQRSSLNPFGTLSRFGLAGQTETS